MGLKKLTCRYKLIFCGIPIILTDYKQILELMEIAVQRYELLNHRAVK